MAWQIYIPFQINEFLDDTAAANSEFIKVVSIGKSYEGREMKVIEIRKAGPGKPNVWIEAGKNSMLYIVNDCIRSYYHINEK